MSRDIEVFGVLWFEIGLSSEFFCFFLNHHILSLISHPNNFELHRCVILPDATGGHRA
jgi:hypothetical protein